MDVLLSAAVSIDGYLDDDSPERLRLSSYEDWQAVLRLRAQYDAILVGANTVRRDNPSLVIRDPELRAVREAKGLKPDIVKITATRSGNLDPQAAFFTEGAGRKIVFSEVPIPALAGVADVVVEEEMCASTIVYWLEENGFKSLVVEGGAEMLAMFLVEGMAKRLRLAMSPMFVGAGTRFSPWLPDGRFELESVEKLGDMAVMNFKL